MKIVFAGTPEFAVPSLNGLFQSAEHEIIAVYTQPDRPAGRGRKIMPSAVKAWALEHHLPVYQPLNFKSEEAIETLKQLAPDIMVVIAYGLILPRSVLALPRLGCINVHASLLPRWRGASPIQHALLHGDKESGVTIMQMDAGMDTGAILMQATCPVEATDTSETLHDRLAHLSILPLLTTLSAIQSGLHEAIPQASQGVTYAHKIEKQDALIQWSDSAEEIVNKIRAFNPWPVAWTHAGETILRIHGARVESSSLNDAQPGCILALDKKGMRVATGNQDILIEQFQFPGGKVITVADWINTKRSDLSVNMVLR